MCKFVDLLMIKVLFFELNLNCYDYKKGCLVFWSGVICFDICFFLYNIVNDNDMYINMLD